MYKTRIGIGVVDRPEIGVFSQGIRVQEGLFSLRVEIHVVDEPRKVVLRCQSDGRTYAIVVTPQISRVVASEIGDFVPLKPGYEQFR